MCIPRESIRLRGPQGFGELFRPYVALVLTEASEPYLNHELPKTPHRRVIYASVCFNRAGSIDFHIRGMKGYLPHGGTV